MLGLNLEFHPRFVRYYTRLAEDMHKAVKQYIQDIRKLNFPSEEESY